MDSQIVVLGPKTGFRTTNKLKQVTGQDTARVQAITGQTNIKHLLIEHISLEQLYMIVTT